MANCGVSGCPQESMYKSAFCGWHQPGGVGLPPKQDLNPVGSTFDPARHPSHYHEGKGIDPIGVMRETFTASELEGFFKGSALKYIMRYQSKNGKLDLEKAKNYVDLLISLYTGGRENGNETK